MRRSKHFSLSDGLRLVMILWILSGIVIMPACSKKSGEETSPSENVSVGASQDRQAEMTRELQQLRAALIMMQGVTLKKHPELGEERKALSALFEERTKALLKARDVDLQEMVTMQKKLQDKSLPEAERIALMTDFQAKAEITRQTRLDAQNDEAVQEAFKKYEAHLKEALKADHPDAAEKMTSFDKLQAELEKLGGVAPGTS